MQSHSWFKSDGTVKYAIAMVSWIEGQPVTDNMGYGGIERVVRTLSRELARQGHFVYLIAPVGSHLNSINNIMTIPVRDFHQANAWLQLNRKDYNIIHDHTCWSLNSPARNLSINKPFVSTTHVMHAIGWRKNVVYLSKSQRAGHAEQLGLSVNEESPIIRVPVDPFLKPGAYKKQDYLLYLGAVAPHKGVREAVRLANIMGKTIKIAGAPYGEYADEVAKMPRVSMLGEVNDSEKIKLIQSAYGIVCFSTDIGGWTEPGCGVIGEANTLGTMALASHNGCLPELVHDGVNGFTGNTVEELAVKAIEAEAPLAPEDVMTFANTEWNANHITNQYLKLYQEVMEGRTWN